MTNLTLPLTVCLGLIVWATSSAAAEYPFTKEKKVDTKVHRYAPEMLLVDLDGDRDLDIVARTSGHYGEITWWKNGGKGKKFKEAVIKTGMKVPYEPGAFAVGDLDGNKAPDIVFSTRYGGLHWTSNAKKKAKVWKPKTISKERTSFTSIAVGDVDGDGDNDVVVGGNGIFWFENLGRGKKWDDAQEIYTSKRKARQIALVDLDDDDDLDIVFAGESYGLSGLYTISNEGGPWKVALVKGKKPEGFDVRDINGDGSPDIFARFDRHVTFFLNHNHEGIFAEEPIAADERKTIQNAALADIDRDGEADLVIAYRQENDGLWWRKNPGPEAVEDEWTATQIEDRIPNLPTILPVDFDKDGDEDLLMARSYLGEWAHHEVVLENKARKPKKKRKGKGRKKKRRR